MGDLLHTRCPHCGHILIVNVKFIGREWPCSNCGDTFEIPPFADDPVPSTAASLISVEEVFGGASTLVDSDSSTVSATVHRAEPTTAQPVTPLDSDLATQHVNLSSRSEKPPVEDDDESGATEIRSMLEHLPPAGAAQSGKSELLRSFLALQWSELVRNDFFNSVPLFVGKIAELTPLVSQRLAKQIPKLLSDVRRRWDTGQNRRAAGERVLAAHQGLPQLARTCIDVAADLFASGDHEFVHPLADVAFSALFLADAKDTSEDLIRAFSLRTLAGLIRIHPTNFDEVIGYVRRQVQNLRGMKKKIAPLPEELNRITCDTVHLYYSTILRHAIARNDRTHAQKIVPASLCYVSRLLVEEGKWLQLTEWVSLCSAADSDSVDQTRELGLLLEQDPLEAPPKSTRADFIYHLQTKDVAGAISVLEPWFTAVCQRLQGALQSFLDYRTPESDFLILSDNRRPDNAVRSGLQDAIGRFYKGDLPAAQRLLNNLPALGAVGTHPLVREWRALVHARMGARPQAELLLRQSCRSHFVLEDTVWNLAVLLASEGTLDARRAAFAAFREYLVTEELTVYAGGEQLRTTGLHIAGNLATTLTIVSLALALGEEQFLVDFVINTPRNQLRQYDLLLPIAFVLASRLNHPRLEELRGTLIGQWTGARHAQWADPRKLIDESEIQRYINDTGGSPLELEKLAEYLEERKKYHGHWPRLHQYLAELYQALEQPEKEFTARCEVVYTLGKLGAKVPDDSVRAAVELAITTAKDNNLRDKLPPLVGWLRRNGKLPWVKKWQTFLALAPEQPADARDARPPATPDGVALAVDSATPRLTMADAIRTAQVDGDVMVDFVTSELVNDAPESDLVLRIANTHPVQLTDMALYITFEQATVHTGSAFAPDLSPHGLKDRAARSVSYEAIPVYCPPDVPETEVTAVLLYTLDGQRRYRETSRPTLPGRPFDAVTGHHDGIPYNLYCYGGMVSGAYAHTFKGRERLREKLLADTHSGNMTHFLDGIKRVGKSSICANLVYDPPADIVAVHLDLERYALGDEKTTTVRFAQHLLDDISTAVASRGYTRPDPISNDRWESEPTTLIFLEALRRISERLAPSLLLLMFDEVQVLLASVENSQRVQDPQKYVRRDFLDMLSAMLNDEHRAAQLLFTASERFETIKSGGYYNLFNRLTPINLNFLDAAATGDILNAGIRDTRIRFVPEATASVWQYLRGYPAHVQQMGDKLMEKLRLRHRTIVLPQDVAEIADSMIADSVLFDYQCNRDTIRREEVILLEAIFRGQEQNYGKRAGLGRGVPVKSLVTFAPGLESARVPVTLRALKNQQVITEERDGDGQLVVRINGLLIELWLARLRDERGVLREEAFPVKRPSMLDITQSTPPPSLERRGCAVWVDFENVARSNALRSRFLGLDIECKQAAEDFGARLLKACVRHGLDVRDKRIVAPWGIEELQPYQDAFEVLGFKPINCLKGTKNAADFVIAQELAEKLPLYASVAGIGTLLLVTADNDFATTITYAKGAGMRTVVWGSWDGRPSRDLKTTADATQNLMDVYTDAH